MSKKITDFVQIATPLTDIDRAKLIRVVLPAGDTIQKHEAGDRIIYVMNDHKIKYNSSKFGTIEKEFKEGASYSMDADTHSVVNTGDTTAKFLIFILKDPK